MFTMRRILLVVEPSEGFARRHRRRLPKANVTVQWRFNQGLISNEEGSAEQNQT